MRKLINIFSKLLAVGALIIFGFFIYKAGLYILDTRFINPKVQLKVSGTGSMYPTFAKGTSKTQEELEKEIIATPTAILYPNGITLFGKTFSKHTIERGDIVSFEVKNEATGYIKRVIGVGGDDIILKNGIVNINGVDQKEPYTARAHSTFGGKFLSECTLIKVPEGRFFVMGDNRKASSDSRESLGFIEESAIDAVIPLDLQHSTGLTNTWRDTNKDLSDSTKIRLDTDKFIQLLNDRRKIAGIPNLKRNPLLDQSALLKAQKSIENKKYSQEDAFRDAGYSNIVSGEIPIQGYYDENELIENIFTFVKNAEFVLDKDFQEIGVASYEGLFNGCPSQFIIIHFAGYIPPNYKPNDIDNLSKTIDNLNSIKDSWQKLKTYDTFYSENKQKVDRINEIISIRLSNITEIRNKMASQTWLTPDQMNYLSRDTVLGQEQTELAKYLNSKIAGN